MKAGNNQENGKPVYNQTGMDDIQLEVNLEPREGQEHGPHSEEEEPKAMRNPERVKFQRR